jgi:glycosyltransferase involved in cell wall biosynthesis
MNDLNICFTSPAKQAYSETFIKNLRSIINANIFYCYGDFLPYRSEDLDLKCHFESSILLRGLEKLGVLKFSLATIFFKKYLKTKKIKLIIANYGQSGAEIAEISKDLKIPLIVHFHGYDASVKTVIEKYRLKYQKMFQISKAVIAVSNEMKQDLIRLGCPSEKIFLLRYSPLPDFLDLDPDLSSNQIIAIGRFVEKKAPHLTLLAMKRVQDIHPEIKLKFIGDGQLTPICMDICSGLDLKNVEFLGVLSQEEVIKEMERSFCFVQHSKTASNGDKEGTPVAVLEAMAAGIPIVSTFHAGIPDIVQNGINGFLVGEGDVQGMANAIIRLYNDRELVKAMGAKNKNFINLFQSQEKYSSDWNKLIEKIVMGEV